MTIKLIAKQVNAVLTMTICTREVGGTNLSIDVSNPV